MILDTTYWKLTGYRTPWGPFDKNAGLNFSFDFSQFAADAGTGLTVQSVTPLPDPRLACTGMTLLANVFTMRIDKVDPTVVADVGVFIPFTLRIALSDTQHDDRTFWLQIRDR